ncbi:MAG: NAD(+) diphosphatase [Clostridia bacterium]|nr:NAD(+) diphosphatase [Clostridia bacterium]
MIQNIEPAHLDNAFRRAEPEADSRIIQFDGNRLLVRYDGESQALVFPRKKHYSGQQAFLYLFSIDSESYFLAPDPEESVHLSARSGVSKAPDAGGQGSEGDSPSRFPAPDNTGADWPRYSLQELRGLKLCGNRDIFAAYTAFHLRQWYRTSVFCGACGARTVFDEKERAKVCPACGNRIYPRINPAVIIGVTNGDRLLITRYARGFAHNALVAGFCEIGETAEQTVMREVREEVGLRVKNIRYFASQPWGIASDLLMGFYCDVDGSDVIHRDDGELGYAQWVPREEIVLQPSDYSLTNEMMKRFRDGLA